MITSKTTSRTLHKYHKELWIWLSENPDKFKWYWPKWNEIDPNQLVMDKCYCFACYELSLKKHTNNCEDCPLDWGKDNEGNQISCVCSESLYNKLFSMGISNKERAKRCIKIANLPWSYKRKEKR